LSIFSLVKLLFFKQKEQINLPGNINWFGGQSACGHESCWRDETLKRTNQTV
jgi:hypothetical protein